MITIYNNEKNSCITSCKIYSILSIIMEYKKFYQFNKV